MSEIDPQQLRRELLLDQAIKQHLDELVRYATAAVLTLPKDARLEESQLRNLLNVGTSSRSVEVIANFVRYQIARKGSDWGTGRHQFGHRVIDDLYDPVKKLADKVIETAVRGLGSKATAEERAAVHALHDEAYKRLAILYLGYLNRGFYFLRKSIDQRLGEEAKASLELVGSKEATQ
jgi:hypothetical protein